MISRSSIHDKINYLSLLLIAFTLPFHILLCSYSIAIFVLNQLAQGKIIEKIKSAAQNKFVLLFAGFYILYLLGIFFSTHTNRALFELERKFSILLFPFLLFSPGIRKEHIRHILLSFIAACSLLSLIMVSAAFYRFLQDGSIDHFLMENLTSAADIHRVYASMYFLFCIYILFYFQKDSLIPKNIRWVSYVLIGLFSVMIFLLSSRMITVLTFISFIFIAIHSIVRKKSLLKGSVILIFLFLLTGSFVYFGERFREIISQTYTNLDMGNSDDNHTGPNQRIEIWKASLQTIWKNPWGVGSGDVEEALISQYEYNQFKWGILYKYNAHNQFLETFVGLGIIGLLYILLMFAWPGFNAFREKKYLYLSFLLLFTCACLTESMLCTQKGIVFYAFFNALLAFQYPYKNS